MSTTGSDGSADDTSTPGGDRAFRRYERERDAEGRPANARPRDRFGAPLPRGAVDEMAHRREPEDVVATIDEALTEFRTLFDARRFFEAHEFGEFIWKHPEVAEADRDYWKGVTQVAVGCVHIQRGNAVGADKLLARAAAHLDRYPPVYAGVAGADLAAAARALRAHVQRHGPGPDAPFPPLPPTPGPAA